MSQPNVALITGASKGIGRSIAIKFAQEGLNVAITARNEKGLRETAKLIQNNGGPEPLVVAGDLTDLSQIPGIVEKVKNEWGHIDVLVNNAGVGFLKPFLELNVDEFQTMMDLNMRAVFAITQKVVPLMMEQQSGTIINIASLAGKNGFKGGTGYAASKWALRGFAQCLMPEVREHDIRVVTIFPGSVDTRFGDSSSSNPLSKNKMMPEDIADTAYSAFVMPQRTMVSEIDMRPSNPNK
ncbi:MAG: SDR family NAD(P)-dependent oxidoreductase [Caldithrix sp.]|nr:SDR family NAD(P)-dependent oxidoreductase [Caldithrix sp.]